MDNLKDIVLHAPEWADTRVVKLHGTYKGIAFDIVIWNNKSSIEALGKDELFMGSDNVFKSKLNYYIYINRAQLPRGDKDILDCPIKVDEIIGKKRMHYDYFANSFICDLPFHGGVTFYERNYNDVEFDKNQRVTYKIGCDYAHLYDDEAWENYNTLYGDVKDTINAFIGKLKYYYVRNSYDGTWLKVLPGEDADEIKDKYFHKKQAERESDVNKK